MASTVAVTIIGAGPTGLAAANLLGQAGISTLLIEQNAGLSDYPRAISIDDEGLRICQAMGLREAILTDVLLGINARYRSGKRYLATVAPTNQRNGYPLISTFHQPTFEQTLLNGLTRFPCVTVLFQHTLVAFEQDEQAVSLTIRTPDGALLSMKSTYLLGCDGAKSLVRRTLGIAMHTPTLLDTLPMDEHGRRGKGGRISKGHPYGGGRVRAGGKGGRISKGHPYGGGRVRARGKMGDEAREGGFLKVIPTAVRALRRPFYIFNLTRKRAAEARPYQEAGGWYKTFVGAGRKDYAQRWLVIDSVNDDDATKAAIFFCNPARPAVTLPAPHHRRRWEFRLLPGECDEDMLASDTIYKLIEEHTLSHQAPREARKPEIVRRAVYTFHTTIATQIARGRVFLLGDAIHMMPPFAGQGMNSGLRDAHNLCWKLQMVLEGRADSTLLDSYQQERLPHIAEMTLFSFILGQFVLPTNRLIASLRDLFFRGIVNHIPSLRAAFSEMRVKPQPRYSRGYLLPRLPNIRRDHKMKKIIGSLLPQPYVTTSTGERVLLDDVLGDDFTLLRLYEKPEEAFAGVAAIEDKIWKKMRARLVCVIPANATPPGSNCAGCTFVVDVEGKIEEFLGGRRDVCVLVRPDRYVMGVIEEKNSFAMSLVSTLKSLIRPFNNQNDNNKVYPHYK